ncbi:hypothetical protein [Psychromonas aquimarina]|uniref:hypothetical protein n=1 Tax=Psychromonas aquimarina TaxID=444919 RepID=UPI000421CFDF|nr:hypothetical protein [Psychromonas aquimarina]
MALMEPDYSSDDFKQAAAALLPPGEYWQYSPGGTLDKLLTGLALEFKTTHDETQQNILYQADNIQAGWKLSDYQTLLDTHKIAGRVFDNHATPNYIYIDVEPNMQAGELMKELEDYRLPHTAFLWTLKQKQSLHLGTARQNVNIDRREVTADCWDLAQAQHLHAGAGRQTVQIHRRKVVLQYLAEQPVIDTERQTQFIAHQLTFSLVQGRSCVVINRTTMRAI